MIIFPPILFHYFVKVWFHHLLFYFQPFSFDLFVWLSYFIPGLLVFPLSPWYVHKKVYIAVCVWIEVKLCELPKHLILISWSQENPEGTNLLYDTKKAIVKQIKWLVPIVG
jgi:hypothetical protein